MYHEILLGYILCIIFEYYTHTHKTATEVDVTATEILANATSLNSSTAVLVGNVGIATSAVNTLQEAVTDDQQAITRVTDTATETIALTTNLSESILVIKVVSYIVCSCYSVLSGFGLYTFTVHICIARRQRMLIILTIFSSVSSPLGAALRSQS